LCSRTPGAIAAPNDLGHGLVRPAGGVFQIFSAIAELDDPLFAKIDFEWDPEKRRARVEVGDLVRAHSEPSRNPVTGEEHRMITVLPNGWIFREAENLSGFAKARGGLTPVSWRGESLGSSSLALRHVVLRFRGILWFGPRRSHSSVL